MASTEANWTWIWRVLVSVAALYVVWLVAVAIAGFVTGYRRSRRAMEIFAPDRAAKRR